MYPKPARNGYLRLLKEHKLEASSCVMVEDSLVNLVTARKLGMKTIWVTPRIGRSSWVDARISKLY
jgi:putative hydrolase of the HAD superfamily